MDTQRYIEVLEKGDAPNAIVPLIVAEAQRDALERAAIALVFHGQVTTEDLPLNPDRTQIAQWLRARGDVR